MNAIVWKLRNVLKNKNLYKIKNTDYGQLDILGLDVKRSALEHG